jgi:hypothetical protein
LKKDLLGLEAPRQEQKILDQKEFPLVMVPGGKAGATHPYNLPGRKMGQMEKKNWGKKRNGWRADNLPLATNLLNIKKFRL